jgi:uncharacterized membrane protein YoaT (DUF817 family)
MSRQWKNQEQAPQRQASGYSNANHHTNLSYASLFSPSSLLSSFNKMAISSSIRVSFVLVSLLLYAEELAKGWCNAWTYTPQQS